MNALPDCYPTIPPSVLLAVLAVAAVCWVLLTWLSCRIGGEE